MTRIARLALLLFVSLSLIIGATSCATRPRSTTPTEAPEDPASAFPVQVSVSDEPPVTIPQQPKRIVSLSPTATETLYAVGAGDQVVAVDQTSTFPHNAPRTELSALTAEPGAITAHKPDLVIAPDSASKLAESLKAVDIPVLLTPAATSLDGAFQEMETLGRATGHSQQARQLVTNTRTEIDTIVQNTPQPPRQLSYFHEVSPDFYTATSQSFVGSIYSRFGMRNIADPAGGSFPQLSGEHIVRENPDLVFLADTQCCQVTAASAAARPGWNTMQAVHRGQVVELQDDMAGRWGPRVVDLTREISAAVARASHG